MQECSQDVLEGAMAVHPEKRKGGFQTNQRAAKGYAHFLSRCAVRLGKILFSVRGNPILDLRRATDSQLATSASLG